MGLLSVVMPVYNEVRWVETAVSRVLAVPLPMERELVIVDDGSTDGTSERLEDIRKRHASCVRVFRQEKNRGKGAA